MKPFIKENCTVIANNKIINFSSGLRYRVDFDFDSTWKYWKNNKFKRLIMIHTHPESFQTCSKRDILVIKGWSLAFPVPIIFIIYSGNVITVYECNTKRIELLYSKIKKNNDEYGSEYIPKSIIFKLLKLNSYSNSNFYLKMAKLLIKLKIKV